jgi:hypothetical protein
MRTLILFKHFKLFAYQVDHKRSQLTVGKKKTLAQYSWNVTIVFSSYIVEALFITLC